MKINLISFMLSLSLHGVFISLFLAVNVSKDEKKEMKKISLNQVTLEKILKNEPLAQPNSPIQEVIMSTQKKEVTTSLLAVQEPLKKQKIVKKEESHAQNLILKEERKETNATQVSTSIEPPIQSQVINVKQIYIDENLMKISKAIDEQKSYSLVARKMNIQGTLNVEFTITKEGKTINIKAKNGHPILQKSAIETIEKAQEAFPLPPENITITVPMVYSLH
ncbi:MAG: TonB family protein [Campylobacteraceae bacterium]|nr:TonB family protein [Campylobacteraceae bacterium]